MLHFVMRAKKIGQNLPCQGFLLCIFHVAAHTAPEKKNIDGRKIGKQKTLEYMGKKIVQKLANVASYKLFDFGNNYVLLCMNWYVHMKCDVDVMMHDWGAIVQMS